MVTSDQPGFGLYIHWPFCRSKCPYCDFNSHVRESIDEAAWQTALLAELDYWGDQTAGRSLTSIFFGGGTPSLMPPEITAALIEQAREIWQVAPDIEITLEANPTSVEAGKLRAFKAAGVNRVSLGVQAMNDADLKALGRQHSAAEALAAVDLARGIFDRISFDLIYARPHQTVDQWTEELTRALAYAPDHMSLYQLTIEDGTKFATLHQRGELVTPNEDEGAALYEVTQRLMNGAGLPAYEISNHAKPGAECRHNLTYWYYGDYVGIGPGAHGRVTLAGEKFATRTHRAPEEWMKRVESYGHGVTEQQEVKKRDQLEELLLMGLRLTDGISRARILADFGADIIDLLNPTRLATLQKHNLITLSNQKIQATPEGRLRLNAVLGELVIQGL